MLVMKKVAIVVLALVVIVAVFAFYILINERSVSGKVTCDPYDRETCYYEKNLQNGCCFRIVNSYGAYDMCYFSYKFAVNAYKEAVKDSEKTSGGILSIGALRVGPGCTH